MSGRDALLVWFASQEPILEPSERRAIIRRLRFDEDRMREESHRFWTLNPLRPSPTRTPPPPKGHLTTMYATTTTGAP